MLKQKPAAGQGERVSEIDDLVAKTDLGNTAKPARLQHPYRSKSGRTYYADFKNLKALFEHADRLDEEARVNRALRVLEYTCASCGNAEWAIVPPDDGGGLCLLLEE